MWKSLPLLQLNKIFFPDFSLTTIMWFLYVNCWAALCCIEQTMWLPSYPTPTSFPQSKNQWLCSSPMNSIIYNIIMDSSRYSRAWWWLSFDMLVRYTYRALCPHPTKNHSSSHPIKPWCLWGLYQGLTYTKGTPFFYNFAKMCKKMWASQNETT